MAKILVIDDEAELRKLTRTILQNDGHEVIEAETGMEGLDMVKKERPDLILLDVRMPKLDGWEICRKIKSREGAEETPVLIFTVMGNTEDKIRSQRSGADGHIEKPFEVEGLLEKVNSYL